MRNVWSAFIFQKKVTAVCCAFYLKLDSNVKDSKKPGKFGTSLNVRMFEKMIRIPSMEYNLLILKTELYLWVLTWKCIHEIEWSEKNPE